MHWKLSTNQKSKHMPGSVVCADALTRYVQISVEPSYIASLSKGYASLEGVWNAQGVGMNAYVRYPELEDLSKSMYINAFTCRRYMGHKNDRISGAAVFLLREEHGMLHHPLNALTSRHGYPQRLFFRQAKSEQDLTIEFKEPEYYNTFTVYYPFEQKYLLRGSMTIPNDTQPKTPIPMRLMSTTGKIEIIQPPAAMWAYARTHQLVPQLSKKGLLWYMWTNNPEDSLMGTYVQEGGTLLRFTRGRVVVSPSGCRASEHDGSRMDQGV